MTTGSTKTIEQLVGKLIGVTASGMRDPERRERIRATLKGLSAGEPLATCVSALVKALDGDRSSASVLMGTSEAVLIDATMDDRANVLSGIADIAHEVGDLATEIAARLQAITAQRMLNENRETIERLALLLYKQALLYGELGDHMGSVSLLEEVVELDNQAGGRHRGMYQEALSKAEERASVKPESELHAPIVQWCEGTRNAASLRELLETVGSISMQTVRTGVKEDRESMAEDLALLRSAHPLPVEGADTFLRLLQLRLRGEGPQSDEIKKLRAMLTREFAQKLLRFEHSA